jgi:hypothetical protein
MGKLKQKQMTALLTSPPEPTVLSPSPCGEGESRVATRGGGEVKDYLYCF